MRLRHSFETFGTTELWPPCFLRGAFGLERAAACRHTRRCVDPGGQNERRITMKRTIVGFIAGLLLGSTGFASAGYYYSAQDLLGLRGRSAGDAFVLGYVAGVHDVMAGPYPPSEAKLADIKAGAIELMLGEQDGEKPAHL